MKLGAIVQVPLFLTPYSPIPAWGTISALGQVIFDKQAANPAISNRVLEDGAFNDTNVGALVCSITGLSAISLNPNLATGSPVPIAGYIGGYQCTVNASGGVFFLQMRPQPRAPGNYTLSRITVSIAAGVMPGTDVCGYNFGIASPQERPGILWSGTGNPIFLWCAIFDGVSFLPYNAWTMGGNLFTWIWSGTTYYVQNPAADGWIYTFMSKNASHPNLGFRWTPTPFTPAAGGPDVLPSAVIPSFSDNVGLDTLFQDPTKYSILRWRGGFIVILQTNGAGPTGQTCEVAVCDNNFQTYNLLKFVPQEATGQVALNRPATRWTVKIDTDGILYFNSGSASDLTSIWYSYSPIPWAYPQLIYTPPPPLSLPCYTPCFPMHPT